MDPFQTTAEHRYVLSLYEWNVSLVTSFTERFYAHATDDDSTNLSEMELDMEEGVLSPTQEIHTRYIVRSNLLYLYFSENIA